MNQEINIDIAIIGGGIAGLWLLNKARKAGYATVLFEKEYLGGGQTMCSQGIIHSGVKFALQGKETAASQAIANMPQVWRDCLNGEGDIDLSAVNILSEHQYLWSDKSFWMKLTGMFARRSMKSRMLKLSREQFPEFFQHPDFKGQVFQLDEPVLDVPSLVTALVKPNKGFIYQHDFCDSEVHLEDDKVDHVVIHHEDQSIVVKAKRFILMAGEGNEALLKHFKVQNPDMQRRSLQMVYVKGKLPNLYAHCMQKSTKPRITITSHTLNDDESVWYLGGDLAETGVNRTAAEQIAKARDELERLFPWLDLSETKWSSFFIDRAEVGNQHGQRPNTPSLGRYGNIQVAWPTKLAFAPMLATEVLNTLADVPLSGAADVCALERWPKPQIAEPVWR